MYRFNDNLKRSVTAGSGFTLVEVTTALFLLSMILTSVMVLMNRYVDAVIDMQLRQEAFELARSNMESLLTENRLSNTAEFGTSELNPAIDWSTIVEPFYEPVTNRMWIRAVCTTEYSDSKGQFQEINLEHWITSLTAAQIRQIVAQQEAEDEYMKLLNESGLNDIQETTLAFLEQEGLDAEAYKEFIKQQRREKIKYLSEKGTEKWEEFLEELTEEENEFLEELGMNFDSYNSFASVYVPKGSGDDSSPLDTPDPFDLTPDDPSSAEDTPFDEPDNPDTPDTPSKPRDSSGDDRINWDKIPREFWDLFRQLGFKPPE
jgi:type II secretory pathway pseudopilin PulG